MDFNKQKKQSKIALENVPSNTSASLLRHGIIKICQRRFSLREESIIYSCGIYQLITNANA
jgi:hypothetical protein